MVPHRRAISSTGMHSFPVPANEGSPHLRRGPWGHRSHRPGAGPCTYGRPWGRRCPAPGTRPPLFRQTAGAAPSAYPMVTTARAVSCTAVKARPYPAVVPAVRWPHQGNPGFQGKHRLQSERPAGGGILTADTVQGNSGPDQVKAVFGACSRCHSWPKDGPFRWGS